MRPATPLSGMRASSPKIANFIASEGPPNVRAVIDKGLRFLRVRRGGWKYGSSVVKF